MDRMWVPGCRARNRKRPRESAHVRPLYGAVTPERERKSRARSDNVWGGSVTCPRNSSRSLRLSATSEGRIGSRKLTTSHRQTKTAACTHRLLAKHLRD